MKVRIGSRQSDLARLQAYNVGEALRAAHPGLEIEYQFKESLGDKNLTDPLWKIPERGVFTEDFVADLHSGRTDLVVHSWKDLPTEARPGLAILGTLPRADTRDVLFLRRASLGQPELTLLTSSPRRTFAATRELPRLLPFPVRQLTTKPVRGNVLTRLKKLVAGEGDGLFMAKAALDRLLSAPQPEFRGAQEEFRACFAELRWMVLPLSCFPTAPAQGALAVEGLSAREDLAALFAPVHCAATARAVEKERKTFSSFGGGCHQKIGLTVEEHPRLGAIESFYGELDSGEIRHRLSAEKSPPPPAGRLWPLEPSPAFFRRQSIPGVNPPNTELFVARADALPEGWELGEKILWTAGTDSWRKLAARGIWVSGCSDGLGESIPPLDALAGRALRWTKLTHDRSENDGIFPLLATYHLEDREFSLPEADSYFWMSESSFRRALAENPHLRHAAHASGPGFTAAAIEKVLGRPIAVYINYRHWRNGDPLAEKE